MKKNKLMAYALKTLESNNFHAGYMWKGITEGLENKIAKHCFRIAKEMVKEDDKRDNR